MVGQSVCSVVKEAFNHPERIRDINETLLVLIPKVDHPDQLKDFRPISLCNVIYKIITKIIANRIKGSLDSIIGPN